jgi:hypothetical protein
MASAEGVAPGAGGAERVVDQLEDLIPIAVVIAAGCERCAQNMVRRALMQGVGRASIRRTLGIVAHMQRLACFEEALGAEAVARMVKPILAAKRALGEDGCEQGCCG